MKPDSAITRRHFLQSSTTLAAAIAVMPTKSARAAANEKVIVGLMGAGGRGSGLAGFFARRPDVEIAYVCDPDTRRWSGVQKAIEAA